MSVVIGPSQVGTGGDERFISTQIAATFVPGQTRHCRHKVCTTGGLLLEWGVILEMTPMNARQLETYRERLRQRIDQLRHDALNVDEEVRTPTGGQTGGGLSNVPMHLADLGTDLFHQEMNSTLLENEQYLLEESLAALRRIDAGTYGICEVCGVKIAGERLDALPDARTCVKCSDRSGSGLRSNLNKGRVADKTERRTAAEE